jgi:hypothetical protein
MNLDKFPSTKTFDEIEYAKIFIASLDDDRKFYAIKGREIHPGGQTDRLICIGPLPDTHPKIKGPYAYSPAVLHGHPVLDVDHLTEILPSVNAEQVDPTRRTAHGELVIAGNEAFLVFSDVPNGDGYLNLQTGEIIRRKPSQYYVIKNWKIQARNENEREELLSFPSTETKTVKAVA